MFIDDLRGEMTAALDALDSAVPGLEWLEITDRAWGAITLWKYEAAPERRNLRRIKTEVQLRWGTVALIDILKETVLRTGCLTEVSSVAGSGTLPVEVLAERLMLAIYAYGTNTGIRAVAAGGGHGHTEDEIRYVRRPRHRPRRSRPASPTPRFAARQIGFGITRLLGFELLPRIKQINRSASTGPRPGSPTPTRSWCRR